MNRRRVLRAQGYDYSTPGYYFVTICVQDRSPVFGEVVEGQMVLGEAGHVAKKIWHSLPERFPEVTLDASILMPNHVHGIIGISVAPGVAAQFIAPKPRQNRTIDSTANTGGAETGAMNCAATKNSLSLGDIVRVFKTVTTHTIRHSWLATFGWQPNYYDHIIRNERDLERIRTYIEGNPGNWHRDQDNPTVLCRGDALRRPV